MKAPEAILAIAQAVTECDRLCGAACTSEGLTCS